MRRGAVVLVVLLAACSSSEADDDGSTIEATTTTVAETTTTTSAPDPFSVPEDPADIDEAYVEAVLAELERINGDALRLAVTEGLSPRITELINSIYTIERGAIELQVLVDDFNSGFPGVLRPPGDPVPTVVEILTASAECVGADIQLDYAPVTEGAAALDLRVELRRGNATGGINRTPWVYAVKEGFGGPTPMPEPCEP